MTDESNAVLSTQMTHLSSLVEDSMRGLRHDMREIRLVTQAMGDRIHELELYRAVQEGKEQARQEQVETTLTHADDTPFLQGLIKIALGALALAAAVVTGSAVHL